MKINKIHRWISSVGNYDSTCGGYAIRRRYYSDGGCLGWGVDLLGEGEDYEQDAFIGGYLSECKEWAEKHAKAAKKTEVSK